jgi:hypothetical protein
MLDTGHRSEPSWSGFAWAGRAGRTHSTGSHEVPDCPKSGQAVSLGQNTGAPARSTRLGLSSASTFRSPGLASAPAVA